MLAEIGHQFHRDYGVVLRAVLFAVDRQPSQVLRLHTFRAAHPEVIIGDGGFEVWQTRIPEPSGERIISRYTLRELLDSLADFTGDHGTHQ